MSVTSLLSIIESARGLIEEGRHDEAIEVGRRVLGYYPKYWAAYRLLGEACIESGNLEDAEDMFKRVLSVDPEDLLSRVGLATVHDRRGSLDMAIWHMERAYELSPANVQLRSELQRLYLQRDGAARPRLKLTAGGVARLYAKAGRWTQAAMEYRTLLEQNPALTDIQAALAEALWNLGRRAEAAQVCEDLLARYPYCLKANLILGEIWLHNDRETEGRTLLRKSLALDPEGVVAARVLGDRSPIPLRVVGLAGVDEAALSEEERLPAVDETVEAQTPPPMVEVIGRESAPAGAPKPTEVKAAAPGEAESEPIPEWLRRLRQQTPPEPVHAEPVESTVVGALESERMPEPQLGETNVPDWLERLRRRKQDDDVAPAPEVVKAEPKPEPEPVAAEPEPVVGAVEVEPRDDTPEWLRRLREAEARTPGKPVVVLEPTLPSEETPAMENVPALTISPEPEAEAPVEAPPEALVLIGESEVPPVPITPLVPEAESAPPSNMESDWLKQLREPVAAAPAPEPKVPASPVTSPEVIAREAPAPEVIAREAPMPEVIAPFRAAMEVPEPAAVVPSGPEAALAHAQGLRDAGDVDAGLDAYAALVEQGSLLGAVEADLTAGIEGSLRNSRAISLLGDVYMKQGRLQEALQAYKRALSELA